MLTYGKHKDKNYLVMNMYGKSLTSLLMSLKEYLSLKSILQIGIQLVSCPFLIIDNFSNIDFRTEESA